MSYKSQAHEVRHAARLRLMQLRSERIAKRRDLLTPVSDHEGPNASHSFVLGDSVDPAAELEDTFPDATESPMEGADPDPDQVAMSDVSADEMQTAQASADTADLDRMQECDPTDQPAATEAAESGADDQEPVVPDQGTDAVEGALEQADTVSADSAPSELAKLPGVGEGLIWMFQKCEITSLSDLAEADVDDLSSRLGLVGQILNLQSLVDAARNMQNGAA